MYLHILKDMTAYLFLPIAFLQFWYIDAPREIILYFLSLNKAFLQQFSLPLLLSTFFKPMKNEYREGLIWFSIGMGMFVKFWIIIIDILLLSFLLAIEVAVVLLFIAWPILSICVLFFSIYL